MECYRRMAEPCLDIVDASGSPDEVLQSVLGKIKQRLPNIIINMTKAQHTLKQLVLIIIMLLL